MNATAAPISSATATPVGASPTKAVPHGSHFGTDAVYKGYDLMVRRVATHVIREPKVTSTTRADLVRAISSPAVTFAASAADGAILIACPDGLPEALCSLADPLDQAPADAATEKLAQMLDQIDRKLDGVRQDQRGFEHLSDRLEALEFSLRDRLDPEAEAARTRLAEDQLDQIGRRLDMVLDRLAQLPEPVAFDTIPLEMMLAEAEARLLMAVQTPEPAPDFAPVIEAVRKVADQIAGLPQADHLLTRVEGKLDQLAERPAPKPDLSAHERALSDAELRFAALLQRLDQAVDALPDPQTLSRQDKTLAGMADRLADTGPEVARLLAPHLDFSALTARVQTLAQSIDQTATAEGLLHLSHQIAALAERPTPVLDLTAQNDSLSGIGTAVAGLDAAVASLTRLAMAGPDLSGLTARQDAVLGALDQAAERDRLVADQIRQALDRPLPEIDLSGPADALARLGDAIDAIAAELHSLAANQDTVLTVLGQPAQQDALAEAAVQISALLARPDPVPDLSGPMDALDRLGATVAGMAQAIDGLSTRVAAGPDFTNLTAQLVTLRDDLGQPAQRDVLDAALTRITDLANRPPVDLSGQLDQLIHCMPGDALLGMLAEVADQVRALGCQFAAPDASLHDLAQIAAHQGAMARQLQDMTATIVTAAQFDAALNAIGDPAQNSDMSAALARIAGQIADSTTPMPDLFAPLADMRQTLDAMTALLQRAPDLGALHSGFDMVLAAIGQPDTGLASQLTAITRQIEGLADAETPADFGPVIDRIDRGFAILGQPAQQDAVSAALADLSDRLASVAGRPDPVIDMTAQQQSLTRFGTALANAVARLNGVADSLSAGPDLCPILTGLDRLARDLSAPDASLTDALTDLSGQIAVLAQRADPASGLERQAQSIAALAQGVESLLQAYADSPDITAMLMQLDHSLTRAVQHNGSANLTGTLTDMATLLADLAARPDPAPSLHQERAAIATMLAEVTGHVQAAAAQITTSQDATLILAQMAVLGQQMDQQAAIPDQLDRLAQQMHLLLSRPDLAQDIGAQRQNLADLAQGLSDLVAWVEPLTRDLTTEPDFGAILSEFDLLRAELNLPARDMALEQALVALSDQIADLAKSPDGLISLAEQRRSFSSFSNALAFMLQRLDTALGAELPRPVPGTLTSDDLDGADKLATHLATQSTGQGKTAVPEAALANTLSALVQRLEAAVGALTTPAMDTAMPLEGRQSARDPARLIDDLATASTALARIVTLLEGGQTASTLPAAATASLAELFDRLEEALAGRDATALVTDPELVAAIHCLQTALLGQAQPEQRLSSLHRLRLDFAEFVARTLQAQSEG